MKGLSQCHKGSVSLLPIPLPILYMPLHALQLPLIHFCCYVLWLDNKSQNSLMVSCN